MDARPGVSGMPRGGFTKRGVTGRTDDGKVERGERRKEKGRSDVAKRCEVRERRDGSYPRSACTRPHTRDCRRWSGQPGEDSRQLDPKRLRQLWRLPRQVIAEDDFLSSRAEDQYHSFSWIHQPHFPYAQCQVRRVLEVAVIDPGGGAVDLNRQPPAGDRGPGAGDGKRGRIDEDVGVQQGPRLRLDLAGANDPAGLPSGRYRSSSPKRRAVTTWCGFDGAGVTSSVPWTSS